MGGAGKLLRSQYKNIRIVKKVILGGGREGAQGDNLDGHELKPTLKWGRGADLGRRQRREEKRKGQEKERKTYELYTQKG